jgi:hypothetical protein
VDVTPTGAPAGPAPAGDVAPATDGGPDAAPQPQPVRTDSGLPVRVRQASIVPELRDEPAAPDDEEDVVRPPEQVRRMMSSYQTGTRRGRTDAARLLGGPGARSDSGPDPDEQQAT